MFFKKMLTFAFVIKTVKHVNNFKKVVYRDYVTGQVKQASQ